MTNQEHYLTCDRCGKYLGETDEEVANAVCLDCYYAFRLKKELNLM
jgi:formylmethanofuran dehydrogenase subunit E